VIEVCGRSSCKLDECAAEILSRTRRFMRGFGNWTVGVVVRESSSWKIRLVGSHRLD